MQLQIPFETYSLTYKNKSDALYHALRDRIVEGAIPAGTRLPASRELAAQYRVSRGTVTAVYDRMAAEGYVQAETGKGTFVAFSSGEGSPGDNREEPEIPLTEWGERIRSQPRRETREAGQFAVDFHLAEPDIERFPLKEWNRCLYEQARLAGADAAYGRSPSLGDPGLRTCIAQQLRVSRGIDVQPEAVAIVNGSMQAIALLAQLLAGRGDRTVHEQPGYYGIRKAIEAAGAEPLPAPVDAGGIVPADWESRLLFVTPSRQFPTGAVLGLDRRMQLLRWAQQKQAIIVEDDYDSEFRHKGRPLEALKALDKSERVVYVGSFSKTMPSFLRIGYAVLPRPLIEPFVRAKELYEPQPTGLLEQKTLAAFIQGGWYDRHLRKMKRLYSAKFWLLRMLFAQSAKLSGLFDWTESDAGLHLFGWWRGTGEAYGLFRRSCLAAGVRWSEAVVENGGTTNYGAFFAFSHLTEEQLAEGVRLMDAVARKTTADRSDLGSSPCT